MRYRQRGVIVEATTVELDEAHLKFDKPQDWLLTDETGKQWVCADEEFKRLWSPCLSSTARIVWI